MTNKPSEKKCELPLAKFTKAEERFIKQVTQTNKPSVRKNEFEECWEYERIWACDGHSKARMKAFISDLLAKEKEELLDRIIELIEKGEPSHVIYEAIYREALKKELGGKKDE